MTRRGIVRTLLVLAAVAVSPVVGIMAIASLPPSVEQGARVRTWLVDAEYLGRTGVRMQLNRSDCGVAALEMLVENAGADPRRLHQWHELVRKRGQGMSLLEMRRAATALGVPTRGVRANLAGLGRLPLPMIVHFDQHFAVLDRIGAGGEYYLRDPANGRMRMNPAAFEEAFTGEALVYAAPRRARTARVGR